MEERRAAAERTRAELDECRRRLEQLGVDAVSLKKWSAVEMTVSISILLAVSMYIGVHRLNICVCITLWRVDKDTNFRIAIEDKR